MPFHRLAGEGQPVYRIAAIRRVERLRGHRDCRQLIVAALLRSTGRYRQVTRRRRVVALVEHEHRRREAPRLAYQRDNLIAVGTSPRR